MAAGDSMAATIRRIFTREKRESAIAGLADIATDTAIDPRVRIQAFECLSRYGWPEEKTGAVGLRIVGKNAQVLVQHIHTPIGISGQAPAVLAAPSGEAGEAGQAPVRLPGTQHIDDSGGETEADIIRPDA